MSTDSVHTVDIRSCILTVLQGYRCYCQPCVPAPEQHTAATADAQISVAALTIILMVAVVVLGSIGVIVYKLHHEVKMPAVTDYLP